MDTNEFFEYLQTPTGNGQTIYGHLAQILAQVLDDHPANPVDALSSISLQIKASASDGKKGDQKKEGLLTDDEFAVIEDILNHFERHRPKVQQRYADVDGKNNTESDAATKQQTEREQLEERRARLLASKTTVANIMSLNTCLQMFGEGLESNECVLLRKRIEEFVYNRRGYFSSVRFFGRFTHAKGHYYVLECLPIAARKCMYDPLKSYISKEAKCEEVFAELRELVQNFATRYLTKTTDSVMEELIAKKKKEKELERVRSGKAPRSAPITEQQTQLANMTSANNDKDDELNISDYVYMKKRQVIELSEDIKAKLDPESLGFDLTTIAPQPEKIFLQPLTPPDLVHPQGVNRFVYFVSNGLYDTNYIKVAAANKKKHSEGEAIEWIRLPDCTTEQLTRSRFINSRFSGNLYKIFWRRMPLFPGLEMHYLRCVIARIKHSTEIAPANTLVQSTKEQYNIDDDPEENTEIGNEAFEITEEDVLKTDRDFKERRRYARWYTYDKEKQELLPSKAFLATDFLPWPVPNPEPLTDTGALDFATTRELDNWVHAVPVLSHRGKVLPYNFDAEKITAELEQKLEEDIEEEDNDSMAGNEDLEEEIEPDLNEDGEPLPLTGFKLERKNRIEEIKKKLEQMKEPETDQTRILKEKRLQYKRTALKKTKWVEPKAYWEMVRDPWDQTIVENPIIYKQDRWFGMEIPCCDIHAAEMPIPEKIQEKIDKEQEMEDENAQMDEVCKNGDEYGDGERPEGDRPELLAPITGDNNIVLNDAYPDQDQPDEINVVTPWVIKFVPRLADKSPVIVKSNKWTGAVACAWKTGYGCVYIGDGKQAGVGCAFDLQRFAMPPPMLIPPANILEENDPELEVENEVKERLADQERKKRDRDEKRRLAEQEAEEELRRQREEEQAALEAAEREQQEALEENQEDEDED